MTVTRCNAQKKEDFLQKVREGVPILKSAAHVRLPHMTLYAERGKDEAFDANWIAALAEGDKVKLAQLEQEADRRAIEGFEKPVYQGGELVGTEQRYSDTLLIVRLKALAPERYKERGEVTVQGEININVVEQYRDAMKQADDLRAKVIDVKPNGSANGHANGNGHARTG